MVVTPAEVAADHAGLLFGARRGRCRRGRSSAAPGNAPRSGCLASSAVIGTPQLDRVRPCEQGDAPRAQATTEHPPCSPTGGRGPSWCAGATAVVLSLIHISEPTRQAEISYAVFCLKKKKKKK